MAIMFDSKNHMNNMSETDNLQLPIDVSFLLSSAFEAVIWET